MGAFRYAAVCAVLLAGAAHAGTDADVARQFGLLGLWAQDCSKPANLKNTYENYAEAADGTVLDTLTVHVPAIDGVDHLRDFKPVVPDKITINWESKTGTVFTVTIEIEGNRQHGWRSVKSDGKVLIDNGNFTSDGTPTPWFQKCGAGAAP